MQLLWQSTKDKIPYAEHMLVLFLWRNKTGRARYSVGYYKKGNDQTREGWYPYYDDDDYTCIDTIDVLYWMYLPKIPT